MIHSKNLLVNHNKCNNSRRVNTKALKANRMEWGISRHMETKSLRTAILL